MADDPVIVAGAELQVRRKPGPIASETFQQQAIAEGRRLVAQPAWPERHACDGVDGVLGHADAAQAAQVVLIAAHQALQYMHLARYVHRAAPHARPWRDLE